MKKIIQQRITFLVLIVVLLGLSAGYFYVDTNVAPAKASIETTLEEVTGDVVMEDNDTDITETTTAIKFGIKDMDFGKMLYADAAFYIYVGGDTNYYTWTPTESQPELEIALVTDGTGVTSTPAGNLEVPTEFKVEAVETPGTKIKIEQHSAPKYHKNYSIPSLEMYAKKDESEIRIIYEDNISEILGVAHDDMTTTFNLLYQHLDAITVQSEEEGFAEATYEISDGTNSFIYTPGVTAMYVSDDATTAIDANDTTKGYILPTGVELTITEKTGSSISHKINGETDVKFTLEKKDLGDGKTSGQIKEVTADKGYEIDTASRALLVSHDEYPRFVLKPVDSSGAALAATEARYTIWNANDTTTDATTATDFIADATSAYTMYIHPTTADGKIKKDDTNHIYVLPANGKYHITETYLDSKYSKATGRCDFTVAEDGTITLATTSTSAAEVYDKTDKKGELKINHTERNFIDFSVIDILKDTRAFNDGVFTFKSDSTTSDATDITYDASKYKLEVVTGDKITTDKVGDITIIQLPATHKITITEKTPPKSCFTLGTSKKELSFKPTATGTVGATTDITGAVTSGEGFYVEDKAIKVKYPRRLGVRISDLSGNSVGTMKVTMTPGTGENVTFAGDYGISQERITENSSLTLIRGSGTSAKTETYTYPVTLKFGATSAYSATTVATATITTSTHNSVAANTITVAADGTVSGATALTELAVTAAATTPGYYYDPVENIITIRHSVKSSSSDATVTEGIRVKLYPANSSGDAPDTSQSAFKSSDYEYFFREFQGDDDDFKKLSSSEKTLDGAKSADWGSWQKMTKLDSSTWMIEDIDLTGDTYYQLREVSAPNDYKKDEDGVIFKYDLVDGVKKNSVEGQGEEANTDSKSDYTYDTLNLYNTKEDSGHYGDYIYVNKFAVGGSTMLSGAKFSLYEGNAPARTTSSSSSSSSTSTSSSGGTLIKSWVSSATNRDANKIFIKTLNLKTNTTYTIRETAAPTGYQMPTVDWQFRIGTDGWIVSVGTSSSLCIIGNKNNTITIYNQTNSGVDSGRNITYKNDAGADIDRVEIDGNALNDYFVEVSFDTYERISRVRSEDSNVASINNYDKKSFYIRGIRQGETNIIVRTESGEEYHLPVSVGECTAVYSVTYNPGSVAEGTPVTQEIPLTLIKAGRASLYAAGNVPDFKLMTEAPDKLFKGWKNVGGTVRFTAGQILNMDEWDTLGLLALADSERKISLEADWGELPYSLKYMVSRGSGYFEAVDDRDSFTKGQTVTLWTEEGGYGIPSPSGYVFSGWSGEKGGDKITAVDTSKGEDITLWAVYEKKKITIQFVDDKDTSVIPGQTETTFDDLLRVDTVRSKEGYIFKGWKENSVAKEIYPGEKITSYMVDRAVYKSALKTYVLTLNAYWEPIKYSVAYHYGVVEPYDISGTPNPVAYTVDNARMFNPFIPVTKSGAYAFAGWYTDEALTKEFTTINTTALNRLDLYAKWDIVKVSVLFDGNRPALAPGGVVGTMSAAEAEIGKTLASSYTLNEFEQDGWAFGPNEKEAQISCTKPLTASEIKALVEEKAGASSVRLYAHWRPIEYEIHYNGAEDGKAGVINNNPSSVNIMSPATIELKPVTRGGYTFKEWKDDSSILSSDKKSIDTAKVIAVVKSGKRAEITAVYQPLKVTISYYPNPPKAELKATGSMKDTVKNFAKKGNVSLAANKFKIPGYTFVGWSTESDNTSKKLYENKALISDNMCSKASVSGSDQALKLYAQWKPTEYEIKYSHKGAKASYVIENPNPGTYTAESPVVTLCQPFAPGFIFSGWYYDKACRNAVESEKDARGNVQYLYKYDTPGTKTVYAKWTPLTVTIRYDSGVADVSEVTATGNTNSGKAQTITFGKGQKFAANKYKITTPKNYAFAGWMVDKKATSWDAYREAEYTDKQVVPAELLEDYAGKTITLYAVYQPKPYKITVYRKLGKAGSKKYADWDTTYNIVEYDYVASSEYLNGDDIDRDVERAFEQGRVKVIYRYGFEGYTYDGWYTSTSCKLQSEFTYFPTSLKKNRSLYVKFVPERYTIEYDSNNTASGVMESQYADYGTKITLRKNDFISYSGDKFIGWSLDPDGSRGRIYKRLEKVALADIVKSAQTLGVSSFGRTITLYPVWEN